MYKMVNRGLSLKIHLRPQSTLLNVNHKRPRLDWPPHLTPRYTEKFIWIETLMVIREWKTIAFVCLFLNYIIYPFSGAHMCHKAYMKARERFSGISFLLLPCGPWGLNSGLQPWQQALYRQSYIAMGASLGKGCGYMVRRLCIPVPSPIRQRGEAPSSPDWEMNEKIQRKEWDVEYSSCSPSIHSYVKSTQK